MAEGLLGEILGHENKEPEVVRASRAAGGAAPVASSRRESSLRAVLTPRISFAVGDSQCKISALPDGRS